MHPHNGGQLSETAQDAHQGRIDDGSGAACLPGQIPSTVTCFAVRWDQGSCAWCASGTCACPWVIGSCRCGWQLHRKVMVFVPMRLHQVQQHAAQHQRTPCTKSPARSVFSDWPAGDQTVVGGQCDRQMHKAGCRRSECDGVHRREGLGTCSPVNPACSRTESC